MSNRVFTGQIGRTLSQTNFSFREIDTRPQNAPNVVYVVLDDLGFAGLSCYGSDIETPNLDRLAAEGVRFNNFHTTAICSATRASLLTGANHHEVGVSSLVEMDTGCDNAIGHISNHYATIAEILKEYDYSTYASGKWHLAKYQTPAGPFDQWPLGRGFDRYYGYLVAEADHYHPPLVRDNSFVKQPKSSKDGYHCTEDFTDAAIEYVYNHINAFPDKPFFLYLAYGAMHSPHHAPKEYIEKYKGKFDDGWDVIRKRWFENQKKIGIIPKDAELTDRAPFVPAWDSLDEKHKKLYAKFMEVFAGTLTYTDENIGRLIEYLRSTGTYDNTVFVFLSDNGATAEGGTHGRINRYSGSEMFQTTNEDIYALEHIDEIGGEYSYPIYPSGWANALNAPFQWYKMFAHEGGVKDDLIVRYPKLIKDPGSVRRQYHHVSDITPTILDIIGVDKPEFIKGVWQKPFTGTSFKYALKNKDAEDQKHVQYYEMLGNRAIYKDGWKAVVNHEFTPDYKDDVWELYHVDEDYSEKHNVADQYPEKLRELQEEFFYEAGKNHVFPLIDGKPHSVDLESYGDAEKEREWVFKNVFRPFRVHEKTNMILDATDYFVEAVITRKEKEDGVLFSKGTRFGGIVFYIKDNYLKFVYNANRESYDTAISDKELPSGQITVRYEFDYKGKQGADVRLYVNGEQVGETHVRKLYYMLGLNSDTTLRENTYTEIAPDYEAPFEFKGEINKLIVHKYGSGLTRKEVIEQISKIE